mmetsp:Transcript_13764/g.29627  ORF Transcript_13764/g.29627 Transcript_13764/m.29627 type:complete len:304 (-) Transcript_13764:551-1462(-)|eukprot:CAMPEP_0202901858 /NCGR_PEP_ID=MMETSP1392-20130828/15025_1 /ASSEMBLY_ACC=CAM_ASM_000868 /TAXON_ID=225041 /ORGANISM="Chlamydomonas chlamydogama, Strain SAG 11-48b" /LENGTH=303 /DNA_ID=CAMNT_0049588501 /DNA_START=110 /DNA_END=1021 /DNA_ORIENTATION=+
MDQGEGPSSDPVNPIGSAYLDFLGDDFLSAAASEFLDSATLATTLAAVGQPAVPTTNTGKGVASSKRSASAAVEDEDCQFDDSDEDGIKTEPKDSDDRGPAAKKAKSDTNQAARNKACREKARREKINERFIELAKLIEPGKEPKTDKPTILGDAIKYVQQLTVENHQLRQLNKFLEERVAQYEKERGHQLYQQSLMMQGMGGQAAPMMMQQGMCASGASTSSQFMPPPMQPTGPMMMHPGAPNPMQPFPAFNTFAPPGAMNVKPALMPGASAAPPVSAQNAYWVNPNMLDSTQDSLLRPPAA